MRTPAGYLVWRRVCAAVPVNAQGLELATGWGDDIAIKSLAGKEISLRVTIKEVRGRRVPALDDELARTRARPTRSKS